VVLVPDSIRTRVSSPGAAAPWKFTVLFVPGSAAQLGGSVRDGPSDRTSISRPTKRWARSVARLLHDLHQALHPLALDVVRHLVAVVGRERAPPAARRRT